MAFKKGQTWPVGPFVSGLEMTWSDKELREGIPAHKNVVDGNKKARKYITPREFLLVPLLKLVKYTFFPAGKPLKTDTEIRKYRRKAVGRGRTREEQVWNNSTVKQRKYNNLKDPFKWQVRKER